MADEIYPERRYMDEYLVETVHHAMDYDTTRRPMSFYIENPKGIKALFDVIAYSKCKAQGTL